MAVHAARFEAAEMAVRTLNVGAAQRGPLDGDMEPACPTSTHITWDDNGQRLVNGVVADDRPAPLSPDGRYMD